MQTRKHKQTDTQYFFSETTIGILLSWIELGATN
jgi:hypothetical protein